MVKDVTFGVLGLLFIFYLVGSHHFGMVRACYFKIYVLCAVLYFDMNV